MEQEAKRAGLAKMAGVYREEQLGGRAPQLGPKKFSVCGRVCQLRGPVSLVGTEGCWDNLAARSNLIC